VIAIAANSKNAAAITSHHMPPVMWLHCLAS